MTRCPACLVHPAVAPLLVLPLLLFAGCNRVERTLQVDSDPPGALVYLNGQETGRTPMRKNFIWYGTYDVQVRKEGYQTISRRERVWAPIWQVPPFDLIAELVPFPLVDKHRVRYKLRPMSEEGAEPDQLIARAERMQRRLESSRVKRKPETPAPTEAEQK